MRIFPVLFLALASLGNSAFADATTTRQLLNEQLQLEEARVTELIGMGKHDMELAKEIEKLVAVRNKFAADAEAKSNKMKAELAGIWPHNSVADQYRAALTQFSHTLDTFAQHDRQQATRRQEAANILVEQAKGAEEGVANHRRYIADIKAKLANLK